MSATTNTPSMERRLEAVAANIVHQIGDLLYDALPPDVAHEHFVDARQATNARAIEFAQQLIGRHTANHAPPAADARLRLIPLDYAVIHDALNHYAVQQENLALRVGSGSPDTAGHLYDKSAYADALAKRVMEAAKLAAEGIVGGPLNVDPDPASQIDSSDVRNPRQIASE